MKNLLTLIVTATVALGAAGAAEASPKILIVLSGENKITLREGRTHATGFYLNELAVPLKALIDAGYEPVIATPDGKRPTMDASSDKVAFFGGDQVAYAAAKKLLRNLPGMVHPTSLAAIRKQGVSGFSGVFVPGGHAPMEDLLVNRDLGAVLREFHRAGKVTALICHGPIALLSALNNPVDFTARLARDEKPPVGEWIYHGYRMTSFSTAEEKQQEPGQDNALGGYVKFYPDRALRAAGGNVVVAEKWKSHVVRDRELITAQNPTSDGDFTKALLAALREVAGVPVRDAVTVCAAELAANVDGSAYRQVVAQRLRLLRGALVGVSPSSRPEKVSELYLLVQYSAVQSFNCASVLSGDQKGVTVRTGVSVVLPQFANAPTAFFIGRAIKVASQGEFLERLEQHVTNVRETFAPRGLTGYAVLPGDGFEVAFMSWESQEAMSAAFSSVAGKAVVAEAGSFLEGVVFASETGFEGKLESGYLYRMN